MENPVENVQRIPPVVQPELMLDYAPPDPLRVPSHWTNVETFTLDESRRLQYTLIIGSFQVFLTLVVTGVIIAMVRWRTNLGPMYQIFFAGLFFAMQAIGLIRTVFRVKKQWPTYRLIIADQGFMRISAGQPRTIVEPREVGRITDAWDGVKIHLVGGRYVMVSKRVEDWPRLKDRLQSWKPIEHKAGGLRLIGMIVLMWGLFFANIIVFYLGDFSDDARTVLICAIVTLVCTLLRLVLALRQKGLATRTWVSLIIVGLLPLLLFMRYAGLRYGLHL